MGNAYNKTLKKEQIKIINIIIDTPAYVVYNIFAI
jgi:hypothetical protein